MLGWLTQNNFRLFQIIFSLSLSLLAGLMFLGFLYLIRRLKQRNLIRSSIAYCVLKAFSQITVKFWRNYILMDSYKNHTIAKRLFMRQVAFFSLMGLGLFFTFVLIVTATPFLGLLWLILLCIMVFLYIYQCNQDYKEISILCEHISQLYKGNNDYNSVVSFNSPVAEPAMQLNNISCGVKKSVDQQVKAERTKIDLVTNVSHDLKTPLTSIIGYIDLLSKQDLNPEALDYVKILEIKADRLKKIVSDLFQLAKITSGNTELKLEELDCVVLIKQVVADMEDAVLASNKTIKMTFEQENAPIFADGKKLYRVFQNLLDNTLKYSLDGTRIFVDLKRIGDEVVTTIKNTASYELDFDEQEIQERFTRGDKSRTGDGNGLGLSIAKGFTNACGGHLEVDIDGDLFKVSVSFPIKSHGEMADF
jgi:signal transduction histidine kinase